MWKLLFWENYVNSSGTALKHTHLDILKSISNLLYLFLDNNTLPNWYRRLENTRNRLNPKMHKLSLNDEKSGLSRLCSHDKWYLLPAIITYVDDQSLQSVPWLNTCVLHCLNQTLSLIVLRIIISSIFIDPAQKSSLFSLALCLSLLSLLDK